LAVATLWRREIVRFLRQRNRIVGALGTPLVFWLLFGSGFGSSFRSQVLGGDAYLEYSYPGVLILILLFTAIFSTISIIEDRQLGFLQAVLVAPIPRSAITLGKILGGTTLALVQAWLFLLLAPAVGISLDPGKMAAITGTLLLVAFALTAMGFFIAWRMESTQGFHAIMNLVLLPMWMLSGALFPAAGAPLWIEMIITLNPLSYGVAALRRILYWEVPSSPEIPSMYLCLGVTVLFGAAAFAATTWTANQTSRRPQ
jgi:ABC-2 type transport system permease protein